jgi:hypothetical protein
VRCQRDRKTPVIRRADLGEQREAVLAGQLDVHQDQLRLVAVQGLEQPVAAGQADDVVSPHREQRAEQPHDVGAVFDDQDLGHRSPSRGQEIRQ